MVREAIDDIPALGSIREQPPGATHHCRTRVRPAHGPSRRRFADIGTKKMR
jgi:hypothetical protein